MRFHRFFSSENIEAVLQKPGDTLSSAHHTEQWRKVFRCKPGDSVILFDGSGFDFLCEIKDYQGETTILALVSKEKNAVIPAHDITLAAAIVKKDTFEWIVQKATELGVSRIIPVIAERSEKKNINIDRLQKIMIEAVEQSGRATVPVLDTTIDLSEAVSGLEAATSLVWEPEAPLFDKTKDMVGKKVIYIGPEGGWSSKELALFKERGIAVYSMGPQILRAETAVVAGLSIAMFF